MRRRGGTPCGGAGIGGRLKSFQTAFSPLTRAKGYNATLFQHTDTP
ncbi:hypothetical protein HMPREF9123_1577 [Neisseria bacilliformis ATCC BAA-1200]|uniref:Uncharacterized protein n=1 Tax=Neisseria bacilliformis ATCC BAA-1200 TaxID=888742 RepID=F2BCU7_9NEIS|nr:hypothetical protein HMPREF9123_1577 [Neisseria bacilliformis ATCC BAA-1200]